MLTRVLKHIVYLVLPESQCGFRRGCSTIDVIFVARQLQEKCRKQHQDLYMAFVDLIKAFDTLNQDLLWNILRKFGCPPTFIAILQQFHIGMYAQVVMAGSQSSSFPVEVGVKQDCVPAPIIFKLLLTSNHLIALELSIILYSMVSSTCDVCSSMPTLWQTMLLTHWPPQTQ